MRRSGLLKAEEVAKLTGQHPGTILRYAREGKIPFIRINGSVRFDKGEILQWIESQKTKEPT
jgi:excisionase family DNA binding protein